MEGSLVSSEQVSLNPILQLLSLFTIQMGLVDFIYTINMCLEGTY